MFKRQHHQSSLLENLEEALKLPWKIQAVGAGTGLNPNLLGSE